MMGTLWPPARGTGMRVLAALSATVGPALGGAASVSAAAAAFQEPGSVERVAVSADATETGAAVVSMNYRLEVGEGVRTVPFTLLLFQETTVRELSAQAQGEMLAVRIREPGPPRLTGEIELPAARGSTVPLSLDLGYRVENAVRRDGAGARIVLPMLAVGWAPAEARPGLFHAEVALPDGMEAREVFPVTPLAGAPPGRASASLQVLPAVVQIRARPVGSVGLSLPGVLELGVLIVVIACGVIGLRRVRRVR